MPYSIDVRPVPGTFGMIVHHEVPEPVPATGTYGRVHLGVEVPSPLYLAECGSCGSWSMAMQIDGHLPAIEQYVLAGWQIAEGEIRCPDHRRT